MKLNNIFCFIVSLLLVISCSVTKPVIQPVETIYNYKDSVIVHVDSVKVDVPIERIVDVVAQYDSLIMETSVAKSVSYVDTLSHSLKGSLTNKPVQLKKEIVFQDRVIEKEVVKEVPVDVEKIVTKKTHFWYEKILWLFSLIGLAWIVKTVIKLYVKYKVP